MRRHAESARHALSVALRCELRLVQCRAWHSTTFSGERLVLEHDGAPTGDLEAVTIDVPGVILADLAVASDNRLEVLLVHDA